MKIAFLSDIHGNIEAFKTVLDVIDRDNVDAIYIAGDFVGYYYHPAEVIDICIARDDIHCIRGNHDRNFLSFGIALMAGFAAKYGRPTNGPGNSWPSIIWRGSPAGADHRQVGGCEFHDGARLCSLRR